MSAIVLCDDGIEFDGRTAETQPLGGAESAVIGLTGALAARGHDVRVFNNCSHTMEHQGVSWRPIREGVPDAADLYIANRGHRLLSLVPGARRTVFWTHNPCRYMLKGRYLWKLWRRRPVIVFSGGYHESTLPRWVPDGGRKIIPLGLSDMFCNSQPAATVPPRRAIFTSNPLRGLDWLLDVWSTKIRPGVPTAELHLYAGAASYGGVGQRKLPEMRRVLERAAGFASLGVVVRDPVSKGQLVQELRSARCMLYRGDENETFCLSLAEAQAMGVPCIVEPIGSVVERVIDGETGIVAPDDEAFAGAAIQLLTDDDVWRRQHLAALACQRVWTWDSAAASFEEMIP